MSSEVPGQTHVPEGLVRQYAECVKRGDWRGCLAKVGSGRRFLVLRALWDGIPASERPGILQEAWPGSDAVHHDLTAVAQMFRDCGYLGDAPKPQERTRLYRGVLNRQHRRGLSWTSRREVAVWFASPGYATRAARCVDESGREPDPIEASLVYTVNAPPESVLARFDWREEDEYVLDPGKLPPVRRVSRTEFPPSLHRRIEAETEQWADIQSLVEAALSEHHRRTGTDPG